jgi:1-pyrroline-5-carboxylate dehydrogenase
MATRLTYTTGGSSAEVEEAFETELARVRASGGPPAPHLLGGSEVAAGDLFERLDPSRTDAVASRAREGEGVVAEALARARAAAPAWRRLPFAERCELLRGAARLLRERRLEIAAAMSMEIGKVRTESIAEVEEAVDLIEAYCAQMEEHDGYAHELGQLVPEERNRSVLRPYGVFGVISPFNFPVALAAGMSSAALVTGNTVVLKPSEEAPRSGDALGRAYLDAGLPEGVFGLVHGGAETGAALARGDLDGIAFTGSADVGRALGRELAAGRYPRPVLAEMGGKNPAIVTAAADLDKAAEGIARAAFGFSGQKCSACSRAVVSAEVHDALVERLVEQARAYRVGDPSDREAATGPVANAAAAERFEQAVAEARRDGELAAGGELLGGGGWFVAPTVVTGLPRDHRLTREELFLPFLTVTPVRDLDEALAEANAVRYGLTAGVFSEHPAEVERFLDEIEAGVVYVNRRAGATTGAWPGIQSFPGWKSSGLSGKGGLGPYYVQQFMREQSRTVVES